MGVVEFEIFVQRSGSCSIYAKIMWWELPQPTNTLMGWEVRKQYFSVQIWIFYSISSKQFNLQTLQGWVIGLASMAFFADLDI